MYGKQIGKIRFFFSSAIRVLRLTKKPKTEDFVFVAKVTGLGILLIGFIGYIIDSLKWLLT